MIRNYIPLPALITAALCFGHIQSAAALTINEAVQNALNQHPQLAVARANIAIAQARLIDAGKLENPIFEFSLTSQLADGPDREGSIFIGYSQQFPVTSKLLYQRDLGIAAVKLASAEVFETERQFIIQVQSAYIDAVGATALIEVLKQLENTSDEYVALAKGQARVALASELDVAAAETEKALATQSRTLAECDYREAIARLKSLVGMERHHDLRLSQNLNSVISTLKNTVRYTAPDQLNRADVVAARVKLERAKVDQKLARSEALEDWELETGYEAARSVDEPEGVERERFVGIGVKIPLPVRRKGQGRIAEAAAEAEKAEREVDLAHTNALAEVRVGIAALYRVDETIDSLEGRVLPQLKIREQKTRQAFQEGLINFNQVILLRQQQSRTDETLVKARIDKAHALARVQTALGTHPQLAAYDCSKVMVYIPDAGPGNAPFARSAEKVELDRGPKIQAVPVDKTLAHKDTKKPFFKGLFKQFSNPAKKR